MAAAAPIIGGLLVGGASIYASVKQEESAAKARKQTQDIAKAQKEQTQNLLQEMELEQQKLLKAQEDENTKTQAALASEETKKSQRDYQKSRSKARSGRAGTILTGPFGVLDALPQGKTILGG